MDSKSAKTKMDAMNIEVVKESLEPSDREDDVVESELGMRSWRSLPSRLVKRKGNLRQSFLVAGPSRSNIIMTRQRDMIVSSSKKDKEVLSYLDVGLNPRKNGNNIFCDSDLQGEAESHKANFSHTHCEHNHTPKKKGKLNLVDDAQMYKQHAEPTIQSNRSFSLFGKEATTITEERGSSFASYQKLACKKANDFKVNISNHLSHTYPIDYKEKNSSSYSPKWRNESDTGDYYHSNVICKSPQNTKQNHRLNRNHGQVLSEPVSVSRRNHSWEVYVSGKKKCKLLHSKCGETSCSVSHQLSYSKSHAKIPKLELDKRNTNRCRGITSIESDNLYPEVKCNNFHGQQSGFTDNLSASVSQIESDEIFARKLQQQFYQEATEFIDIEKFYQESTRFIDIEKVDTRIARPLLRDESAKAVALAWQGQSSPRDSSFANLYSPHHSSLLFENRSSSTTNHVTTQFRNLEYMERSPGMALFEKFGRNGGNEVDLETRLEILEAVEDMLENNHMFEYDDLASSQSFNDTESNHQHVGSHEMHRFPLSVVQNDNNDEACSVCLDVPSVGETMRHLPCLHKFHKTCIDTWLKRKPSCPVCKSSIL